MAQLAECDLLSLDDAAASSEAHKPAPEVQPAPSVATSAPDTHTGGDLFDDDDWDGFQSAPAAPTAAAAEAPVAQGSAASGGVEQQQQSPLEATAPTSGGVQPEAAALSAGFDLLAGAQPAAVAPPSGFDPAAAAEERPAENPAADLFECFGRAEEAKPEAPGISLISLSDNHEFDPVAQMWAQDKSAEAAPAPAQAAASAAAPPAAEKAADGDDLLGLSGGAAPVVAELDEPLEIDFPEPEKKMITVFYKGEKNIVGWYSDMKATDIREAVMCACDAIIDGGFVLREVEFTGEDESAAEPKEGGMVFNFEDFDQLQNGQTYVIEAAKEREDLKSITGDRWRRLKVQIEPLLHVEAQKAIDRMRRGSNLLKHTHYGFPHLRQFQLSDDRKRLIWYSGAKQKDNSIVQLDEVAEIRLGQTTPNFLHYRLPMLEHLSFSLVYGPNGSKTLDLTCKDEFEFDHWVTGLKAVLYHFKNRQISKEELLGHSKRFKKALEKSNCGIKLTKLPEVKEKGHVGLDDCIEIAAHTPPQLEAKMSKLRERLKTMSQQVARLDHHAAAEMEVDLSLLTGQGPAYASVFDQDEDAADEEMEIRRMHELVEQTTQVLQQSQADLNKLKEKPQGGIGDANTKKKKESAACKHIDQLLWKAEVDLENVEDMYMRHVDNQKDTTTQLSVSVAEINRQITAKFEEVKGWFGNA